MEASGRSGFVGGEGGGCACECLCVWGRHQLGGGGGKLRQRKPKAVPPAARGRLLHAFERL